MTASSWFRLAFVLCLLIDTRGSLGEDPEYYARRDTWQDTMQASFEAKSRLPAEERIAGFVPFVSPILRGGDPPQHVRLRVAQVQQLSLIAEGVPDFQAAHADWADAKLIAADGSVTYLSDCRPLRVEQPYGTLQLDKSHRGGTNPHR